MVADLITILSQYGQTAVQQIQSNLSSSGTNATGKTSRSLKYSVTKEGDKTILKIIGRPFFATVETGRKPTPQYTKPSFDFVQSIKEWVNAKGLPEGSAYAIAKHIHQKGTKLYSTGGRTDIYSNIINQNLIDTISKDVLTQFANLFINNVKQVYGSNSN